MTTAVLAAPPRPRSAGGLSAGRLAWRNLWRNPRRTWLTAGGIAFAVWLLVFGMSTQDGSFDVWIDNVARLLTGHVQIQHPAFAEDPALEHRLEDSAGRMARIGRDSRVEAVLPRTMSFALVSAGERSFGAQVVGVDPERERGASSLPGMVSVGRYLHGPGEAVVGTILARNLGLLPGDEVVMLGSALNGGVAAAVARVVGLVDSGQAALDRGLLQIHIDDFRSGWNLGSEDAHTLVVLLHEARHSEAVAQSLTSAEDAAAALDWRALMPEAEQTIELKRVGTLLFFALLTVIVAFSVVNTFMMTVFERKPEYGMLLALGMRRLAIARQLSVEACWLALLGTGLGLTVAAALVAVLSVTGLPLPADAAGILAEYQLPDRMYPTFSGGAALAAALVMLIGTQVAVLVPAWRLARLSPMEALRAPE